MNGKSADGYDLAGAIMSEADFTSASFRETVMSKAYARDSKFTNADFSNGVVDRVSFDGSDLRGAIFANAVLTGTSFTNANLEGADFSEAFIGDFELRNICKNPTLSGENAKTGAPTRAGGVRAQAVPFGTPATSSRRAVAAGRRVGAASGSASSKGVATLSPLPAAADRLSPQSVPGRRFLPLGLGEGQRKAKGECRRQLDATVEIRRIQRAAQRLNTVQVDRAEGHAGRRQVVLALASTMVAPRWRRAAAVAGTGCRTRRHPPPPARCVDAGVGAVEQMPPRRSVARTARARVVARLEGPVGH